MSIESPTLLSFRTRSAAIAEALPSILTFQAEAELMDLRRSFLLILSDALGTRLARARDLDDADARQLAERFEQLPTQGFMRLMLAPETVNRLLWPERWDDHETARFLTRAAQAELIRAGAEPPGSDPMWSALGDWCAAEAAPVAVGSLDGFPPIVLGDPALRTPLLHGTDDPEHTRLTDEELALVADRLHEARTCLERSGPEIWAFARDYTSTLVLRRGSGTMNGFCSSSPERYVGRSILWNPHLPEVGAADLAEALVHEAFHTVFDSADALLSRLQPALPRWVTDSSLYDGVSRTTSPWTGRDLDVPTYVHAYLVWYGLLCFWSQALAAEAFDSTTARGRVMRAGTPFMTGTALSPLRPFQASVRSDLWALLERLEAHVLTGVSAVNEGAR